MAEIDLTSEEVESKAVLQRNSETVRRGFWPKLRKLAGRVPFVDDLATAYFCAVDPQTPTRVRGVLLAALAYFVIPTDLVPDFIAAFGFTDDASVAMAALGIVGGHIRPEHRFRARRVLDLPTDAGAAHDKTAD